MDRRRFLAVSAGLAAVGPLAARAGETPPADALPPSIAALTSLAERAQPITPGEFRARIENAMRRMAAEKLDAVVLTPGTSLAYFTGIRWWGGERLFACVLTRTGAPFFVCPFFEEERARALIGHGPFDGATADVRTWQEEESPYELVARGLADRRAATGRIGIDETAKFVFVDGIATAAARARVVSATPVTAGCRMVKDAHELELMQIANDATWQVYRAVYRALEPGMTQARFAELVRLAYGQIGFAGEASVQTGEYTALPHGSDREQILEEGAILMVDDGCDVHGYKSDITRTFVLGKASARMHQIFGIVRRAQDAALAAARPGVALAAVDAAARKVIVDAGFGPGFAKFTHRLGHGIGMDGHEWPYLVKNNMFGWQRDLVARPGMTFSNEPGIYLRGEFGIRLEDDMVITAEGARLFTPQSESLEQPF